MNRGIFAITTGTSNLNIEFINKSVCQTGQFANKETVGRVSGSYDVLAIASPLVAAFKRAVLNLSSQGYHIVQASLVRTDDIDNRVNINCDFHIVGCVCVTGIGCHTTSNCVVTCGIARKGKGRTCGVCRMSVHQPDATRFRFATTILFKTNGERGLVERARQT